jgi:hypothetical protein
MNKLNAISDGILVLSCVYSLLGISPISSAYFCFLAGYGSILLAALLGTIYFLGRRFSNEARPMHLLFIHVSTSLGIFGIALGHMLPYFGLTREQSMFIVIGAFLLLVSLYYNPGMIPMNMTYIPLFSIFALATYGFHNKMWYTVGGVVTMIITVKLKEKHFSIGRLDEIDMFHIGLSIAMVLLRP